MWLKKFKLLSHSCTHTHSSVRSMIVDQHRGLLYSTGRDRVIHCQNLQQKASAGAVKTSNARPQELEIDYDLQRLYVSTREGMVMIFDVKDPSSPAMIHTVRLCRQIRSNPTADYIKQMDLDRDRNILVCRSKLGQVSVVQLINRSMIKSTIMETINSYEGNREDGLSRFKWLPRMSCYCEGTLKGYLRLRDVEKEGECMLMLQTQFQEKVSMLHYNKTKNVLFAASRDGQLRIWKVPHEWRSRVIDEREMNAMYEHGRSKTTQAKPQGNVR